MRHPQFSPESPKPSALIVSVDKNGHVNQCRALLAHLGWDEQALVRITGMAKSDPLSAKIAKRLKAARQTLAAAPQGRARAPLVLIASGRASEPLVARYRRRFGGQLFSIFIGSPRGRSSIYDVAIVSRHEVPPASQRYDASRHTLWIDGVIVAPYPREASNVRPPLTAILIGGANKSYDLDPQAIIRQIDEAAKRGKPMSIAFSRRTPEALEAAIRSRAAQHDACFIDREDRAGFLKLMSEATEFLITPDSITMMCEARATGQPVAIFNLRCFDDETSTARFVRAALASGRVIGTGKPSAPTRGQADDGTAKAISEIRKLLAAWFDSLEERNVDRLSSL
jgi:uncharacterized protein